VTPWTLFAWTASIALSLLLALIVLAIAVQAVRSLRKPARKNDAQIISSARDGR
jgi:hypothetical protein